MGRIPKDISDSVIRYGLGYIRPYHREIARRLVLGQMQSDICRDLGMSTDRMSIIVNSPLFKLEVRKLEEMREKGVYDVTQQIAEIAPLALEKVEKIMHFSGSEKLQFAAAESILDRAGFAKTQKFELKDTKADVSNMTTDEIRRLVIERVRRLRESVHDETKLIESTKDMNIEMESIPVPEPVTSNLSSLMDGLGDRLLNG